MNWYLKVLKQYVDFNGRARRKEYWMFALFNFIVCAVLAILDNIVGTVIAGTGYGLFYGIYAVAVLLPGLAVFVRRMHDIGKSGLWFFIAFIPLVGGIWLLVLCCTPGMVGDNQYGVDPKQEPEA